MEKFNILYIDDSPESGLERYLDTEYSNTEYETDYSEIQFMPDDGYECLIRNTKVQVANIIFIDSRLFENRTVAAGKFSGEEFKIILKKYYPFIEVIVITQNDADKSVGTISKYDPNCGKTASAYYAEHLPGYIEKAIDNILVYRRLAEKLEINTSWESTLIEKIINSLYGVGTYDELTKTDIDNLISAFREIQEKIDG
ncbi:hypothetical protein GH810_08920 [Acetobacterium paludosum]|uniref:Uncharacterized protein n=1 Tax=Acetobacterium paludosum TaxID=52693 RepID=A0A923KSI8_9FIRM|nr:hypothetical protein [Acetobacterium paludosum]MBC3888427.1 hypothetical protein [Acetobacterium paludosum]